MARDAGPVAPTRGDAAVELASFRVTEAAEIHALLRGLMDAGTTLHISTPEGAQYATTVWGLDTALGRITFNASVLDPAVHRLVESDEALAVGYLDRVKVQFDVMGLMLVHGRSQCVLQAAIPREAYRVQRRLAYRVRTLERSAGSVSLRHPSIPDMPLSLRVLDVSLGGIALFVPHDVPMLEPGVAIAGAKVELDAETSFSATVAVRHVSSIQPNARGVRLGCELLQIDGRAQRALQRYIDQTQKRRRLMALD